jgi:hypothetical protein
MKQFLDLGCLPRDRSSTCSRSPSGSQQRPEPRALAGKVLGLCF